MSELLENLEIKWQLLLAQAVNFFILLFLLKKFLYKPMLKFLRERKEAIEEGLKKSELAEQKFQEMREVQAKELAKTRKEAQKIIEQSKESAESFRAEILNKARGESEDIFSKAEKSIEEIKARKMREAERELGRAALEGMEYLLREKISGDKKAELTASAIEYIKSAKNS